MEDVGIHALVSVAFVAGAHSTAALIERTPGAALGAHFSVSNTKLASVIAWSDQRVGVDLEIVRRRPHLDRLARRTMHDDEYDRWGSAADRDRSFAQHWTRVEAYLKAIGMGVAGGYLTRPGAEWSVIDLDLEPPFVGAIALEALDPVVSVRWATAHVTSR